MMRRNRRRAVIFVLLSLLGIIALASTYHVMASSLALAGY